MIRRSVRPLLRAGFGVGAVTALSFVSGRLDAQAAGRLVGRIVDKGTGLGLSDVGVQLVGTTIGTMSGVDGRYVIQRVPAGTVTIHVRRLGYQPKTVTGILLAEGATVEQNVSLVGATVQLQTLEVTAAAERGTVNEALDRQRSAVGIVSAVTAEQIARSPDADAAQAVQRVSGVTVQDGKYVFVRGLGERYTTTSLNGARIPSPEPERKVVPLDLFPAGLLQTITTSKTFTPDQPGDFSGAQVDIETREFPARHVVSYSVGAGVNGASTGRRLPIAPTTGMEWLGLAGGKRQLPGEVRDADFNSGIAQSQVNSMVRSFRNVWSAERGTGSPNASTSLTIGGEDPVAGHRVGYIGSLSYSYGQEVRAGEQHAQAVGGANGRLQTFNEFRGATGRTTVLWGGLLNLSTWLGSGTRVSLNNTYSRTADNEARQDSGFYDQYNFDLQRTLLRYVERSVRSNQLRAEHVLGARQTLDWSLTSSGVTRSEPDRSNLTYGLVPDPQTNVVSRQLLVSDPDALRRTFSDLTESSLSPAANYRVAFGPPGRETQLKVGALFRATDRDVDTRSYSLFLRGVPESELGQSAEDLFDRAASGTGDAYGIAPNLLNGAYTARERLGAGYAMIEHPLTARVRLIGGARVERDELRVRTALLTGEQTSRLHNTDVLPSLALTVTLARAQNLRISATQTLSRPEYRELSPVRYQDAIGDQFLFGNPDLRRALIQNYDVRWEWYPTVGEAVSVALFAKRFDHPVEKIEVATTGGSQLSFVNADGAENYGAELEVRKGLGTLGGGLRPLTAFANATLMRSDIRPGNSGISAATNSNRAMVGQSPYVVNAGLTYASATGRANVTVLYNVAGKRIFAAGVGGLPDTYELPRDALDVSLALPVMRSVSAKLDFKNLLDSPCELKQERVVRERFTAGRVFAAGLTWRP